MLVRVLDGIDAFLDQLTSVHPLPLFLAVLAQLGKLSCTSMAWRNVLAAAYPGVRVKRRSILGAYLAGVGVNAIIPLRVGDAVRVVLAHRAVQSSTYTTIVSSTFVLSIFDLTAATSVLALGDPDAGRAPGHRRPPPPSELRVLLAPRAPRGGGARGGRDHRARLRPRLLDQRARARLLGARAAGVHRPSARRCATSARSRSGRRATGSCAWSRSGSCSPPSTSPVRRERAARPGLREHRDPHPADAGRDRDGAGVPPLRLPRHGCELEAARVQRRASSS